jgi:eukaryotic-like serine/threonine-protein kinase
LPLKPETGKFAEESEPTACTLQTSKGCGTRLRGILPASAGAHRVKRLNPGSARPARRPTDPVKELRALYGFDSRALREFSLVRPQCSIADGASGIAYALSRTAELLHDSELLLAANAWIAAAEQHASSKRAFVSSMRGSTGRRIRFASIVFCEPGLFYVKSIICSRMRDLTGADTAARRFLKLAKSRLSPIADLHLGGLGLALAAKHLTSLASSPGLRSELSNFSRRIVRNAWAKTGVAIRPNQLLGFAHGAAGQVFTTYACGEQKIASPLIQQLRETAISFQKAPIWPVRAGSHHFWPGWCNGLAGHLLMWAKVWQHSHANDDRELLDRLASGVWKYRMQPGSICCGAAGQAIALASFSSAVGDARLKRRTVDWLHSLRPRWSKGAPAQSLFQGKLGLLLARIECEYATRSQFPVYQHDALPGSAR